MGLRKVFDSGLHVHGFRRAGIRCPNCLQAALHWVNIRLYTDNGKENGNYYNIGVILCLIPLGTKEVDSASGVASGMVMSQMLKHLPCKTSRATGLSAPRISQQQFLEKIWSRSPWAWAQQPSTTGIAV